MLFSQAAKNAAPSIVSIVGLYNSITFEMTAIYASLQHTKTVKNSFKNLDSMDYLLEYGFLKTIDILMGKVRFS